MGDAPGVTRESAPLVSPDLSLQGLLGARGKGLHLQLPQPLLPEGAEEQCRHPTSPNGVVVQPTAVRPCLGHGVVLCLLLLVYAMWPIIQFTFVVISSDTHSVQ